MPHRYAHANILVNAMKLVSASTFLGGLHASRTEDEKVFNRYTYQSMYLLFSTNNFFAQMRIVSELFQLIRVQVSKKPELYNINARIFYVEFERPMTTPCKIVSIISDILKF